jgi:phosphoenolpyruvate carboxylase
MASQHPDHASVPYWLESAFIGVEKETEECYRCFSELGIDEYKWDWEGKLVDESFMERLMGSYHEYFKKQQIGKDKFFTFRLPNPKVETEFRVGRAFLGLLSAAALAKKIGIHTPPLFEVILPMTETAEEILAVQEAFREITGLKHPLYRIEDTPLTYLQLIPLFEDVQTIMNSADILKKYLVMHKKSFGFTPEYLRPYIARSDPALNAGMIPTVLAIKIALSHYRRFEEKEGIALYPIIGSASLPFRGGITPYTVKEFANEYKGIKTTLLQSAFRYDYPLDDVISAIKQLHQILPKGKADIVSASDEKKIRAYIPKWTMYYQHTVEAIAPMINQLAALLPKRRERVQHIGLFGYSRGLGKVTLPRAISFTAALYSLGVPPELIGTGRAILHLKMNDELALLETHYKNIKSDLRRAGRYMNKETLGSLARSDSAWKDIEKDIIAIEEYLGEELRPETSDEQEHEILTSTILKKLLLGKSPKTEIEQAALLRRSMG